jgi:hypothetical protein
MTVLTNTTFRGPGLVKPTLPLFTMTLAAASNVTLRTAANTAGYTGGNAQITLAAGADMFSTTAATPSIIPGSWPAGITMTLIIPAGCFITGAGGNGGAGTASGCGGHVGSPGGTALNAIGISGWTFQVQNLGTIRGGGGGGGGGVDGIVGGCCASFSVGSAGGGGGQGHNGGGGGAAHFGSAPCSIQPSGGGSGSVSAAGSAGSPGQSGCTFSFPAGNGGAFGSAGGAGPGSNVGGAAGFAVFGNANIVWIGPTGTRIGPVT